MRGMEALQQEEHQLRKSQAFSLITAYVQAAMTALFLLLCLKILPVFGEPLRQRDTSIKCVIIPDFTEVHKHDKYACVMFLMM